MSLGVSVCGVSEMIAKIKAIQEKFPDKVGVAIFAETGIDATEVRARTPVYTGPLGPGKPIPGVLKASVHVEGPFQEGTRIWCNIVAGGAAGAYALRQHEELDWFHTIGQAKYLESVIMESRDHMAGRIAARIHIAE